MKHGTTTGWVQGCRDDCCRVPQVAAVMLWKRMTVQGHIFQVSSERARRKMGALAALGWSATEVARSFGSSSTSISHILANDTIRATSAEKIDRAYEEFEMRIPPDNVWTRRVKNAALAAGHQPPMAWEDIDAGILAHVRPESLDPDSIDEWNIDQALQYHDFSIRFSRAEKDEIVRRWRRDGRSERSLCQLTGWKAGRYGRTQPTNAQEAS